MSSGPPSTARCPVCDNVFSPSESKAMPFCSERCKTIDLGRWLDEEYTLPSFPDPEDDEPTESF